ncbi:MAG TPA: Mur ligase family protein, partial [Burkholderiales bacterium]
MPGRSLAEWLDYIERIHPRSIELGLERVAQVRDVLGRSSPAAIFTVAGTNGKGSTCAILEAILLAAGYKVGLYTSPHLLRYNERVRLDGVPVSDAVLCAAFETVERARGDVALTYFEFGTLAAWEIFAAEALDAVILEVGLGGRLDAVNVFDSDCALLTSVDLDHMDYLGDTRESIGSEKAGI